MEGQWHDVGKERCLNMAKLTLCRVVVVGDGSTHRLCRNGQDSEKRGRPTCSVRLEAWSFKLQEKSAGIA
jgi:hypothetical protein